MARESYDYRGDRTRYTKTAKPVAQLRRLADKLFQLGQDELAQQALSVSMGIMGSTISGEYPSSHILVNMLNLFADNGCKCALIGGLAVNIHGQQRSTEDVDVLVDKFPPAEKMRDSQYMARFGFYKTQSSTGTVVQIGPRRGVGYIEALLANSPIFKWALKTAKDQTILGATLPVVTPRALVALKVHATANTPARKSIDAPDIVSVVHRSKLKKLSGLKPRLSEAEWDLLLKIVPPEAL